LTGRAEYRTFSDVPSEIAVPSDMSTPSPDRRTRKREARRHHLLDLAADLVEHEGIDGLTMAALAEAADYATASLYTYFSSRSALLAALQQRALETLREVADEAVIRWDGALEAATPTPTVRVAALARLAAFSELFLDAPDAHPHEFRLQQQLLVTRDGEEMEDAATIVPAAMAVLDVPRRLLADATALGALDAPAPTTDPLGQPLDGALVRTLAWVVALNGALLTDNLATGLPATGAAIGRQLTASLLRGWGADADELDEAITVAAALTTTD
jgi:AcrR family transcriptional regulator